MNYSGDRLKSTTGRNMKSLIAILRGLIIYFCIRILADSDLYGLFFSGQDTPAVLKRLLPLSFEYSLVCAAVIGMCLMTETRLKTFERLFCFFCGTAMAAGYSIESTGSFFENFLISENRGRWAEFFFLVFLVLGASLAVSVIIGLIRRCCLYWAERLPGRSVVRHRYFGTFLLLFSVWTAVCIIRFPAGVGYDAAGQIHSFLTNTIDNSHHPPASSALMGMLVRIGEYLFSGAEWGYFLCALVQSLTGALIFTYSIAVLDKFGLPGALRTCLVCLYAFSPTYYLWITNVIKDVFYAEAVLFFTVCLTDLLFFGKTVRKETGIFVSGILLSVLRNNGIFIIAACIGCLILEMFLKEKNRRLLLILVAAAVVYVGYSWLLLPALNIRKGSAKEALSIPLQQVARYVTRYSAELSDEEKTLVSKFMDADKIPETYEPALSDPIKGLFQVKINAIPKFISDVWLPFLFRHPITFLDATAANIYGFFYPNAVHWWGKYPANEQEKTGRNTNYDYSRVIEVNDLTDNGPFFPDAKKTLELYNIAAERFPALGMITNSAVLFWLTIYLFFFSLSRWKQRCRELMVLVPSFIGIMVCIASPCFSNNGNRYGLPVTWSAFFLAAALACREWYSALSE